MQGGMKNSDFPPILRFISEMIQDRAILTMAINRKSYMIYRMAPFSMTSNDLTKISRSRYSLTLHISQTAKDALAIKCEYKAVPKLLNIWYHFE